MTINLRLSQSPGLGEVWRLDDTSGTYQELTGKSYDGRLYLGTTMVISRQSGSTCIT
jgi:hypothetical protein